MKMNRKHRRAAGSIARAAMAGKLDGKRDPSLDRGAFKEPTTTTSAEWERRMIRRGAIAGVAASIFAVMASSVVTSPASAIAFIAACGVGSGLFFRWLNSIHPTDDDDMPG